MDPVTGALLAAAVAWASILIVVVFPRLRNAPDPRHVRRLGGITLALFALQVLGLAVPAWVPVAVFFAGLLILLLAAPERRPATA